ncbi:MAG: xanthine dehydrogenase family protein subunit M [Desulfomonilaceae bacterium]|nr:xanthine dehydrogenase family protein subunit M [Desulfomonilaceae bacterium]
MRKFAYLVPKTLDQAVSLHQSHGNRAMYVAGGTDVMVKVKSGKITPDYLISLKHALGSPQLRVNSDTGELHIGSLVTHRTLETSSTIKRHYPILHDAVQHIGSVQIRNVATIGGNLVNAVPSADGAIPLIALDAVAKVYAGTGERTVDLIHFFEGPGQTVLAPGEILTEIVVPKQPAPSAGAYQKYGRREAMELPLIGVGVQLSLEQGSNRCTKARIALGVAAPTPMRSLAAEHYLVGKEITEETLGEAGKLAADESRVRDSVRGLAWYRREMVEVFVKRMGMKCLERIKEMGA